MRTFEGRANETHPIEVYLISPGSTLCIETQLEKDFSVGRAPSSDKKRKLSFRSNLQKRPHPQKAVTKSINIPSYQDLAFIYNTKKNSFIKRNKLTPKSEFEINLQQK